MTKKIEIQDLTVEINAKKILKSINFKAEVGDVIAILGPNGAGKSTLLKTMMHHFDTKIVNGTIKYDNKIINDLSTDIIADMGFYYCSQNPIEIDGVKLIELYKMIMNKTTNRQLEYIDLYKIVTPLFKELNLETELLNRYNNVNFSGGQKKKNELVQMMLFNPDVILLDEMDSGSDIDTIKIIAKKINEIKHNKITFIISHQHELLSLIKPNKVIILAQGELMKLGDYSLMEEIFVKGFNQYIPETITEFEDLDYMKNVSK